MIVLKRPYFHIFDKKAELLCNLTRYMQALPNMAAENPVLGCDAQLETKKSASETATDFFNRCSTLSGADGTVLASGGQVTTFRLGRNMKLRWDKDANLFEFGWTGGRSCGAQSEHVGFEQTHTLIVAYGVESCWVEWRRILDISTMYSLMETYPGLRVWYEIFTTITDLDKGDTTERKMYIQNAHTRDAAWKTTTMYWPGSYIRDWR